jgi:hypothetical protein
MGAQEGIPLTYQPIDSPRKERRVVLLKAIHDSHLDAFVRRNFIWTALRGLMRFTYHNPLKKYIYLNI